MGNLKVSQSNHPSTRVPLLDVLRLAAVGGVILYHFGFWGPASRGVPQVALPYLAPVAQYGFLGVPVFFAISGFVIAYSAEGRSPVGFAIARFCRIYPTFVLCMTLTFLGTVFIGAGHFEATGSQWLANLLIASTIVDQPYVDGTYWSLVIEIVFYAWVTCFIAFGLFPRRIDTIIVAWLAITLANELTIDANVVEKIFLADDSGFFISGLLMYEYYRGRRDARLWALGALAFGTAIFQAVHRLHWLGVHTHNTFDPNVVAVICAVALGAVFAATRIERLPIPARWTLAAGGITYPLYLLHMQLGYVIFTATAPHRSAEISTVAIIAAIVFIAWVIWRYFEHYTQAPLKAMLTETAGRLGIVPMKQTPR